MYRTAQKNHDLDNYDGVITHLETDILECEVQWALGSITMNKVRTALEKRAMRTILFVNKHNTTEMQKGKMVV